MFALVSGGLGFDPRVERQQGEHDSGDDQGWKQDVPTDVVPKDHRFPVRDDSNRAVQPTDVPVRLGASSDLVGNVGTVEPNRVDGEHCAHQRDDARDDEEKPTGFSGVHREQREADNVFIGAAGAGELGVLLVPHQEQVSGQGSQQNSRDQQNVNRIQPRDEVSTGELATKEEG
ncbi:unannotated protein [freshwater metagenome]|uniref:Unannotated protein n=1 Tax=freshwater metagenome TaxID=449393 RepID=A0A6J7DV48_9ZZZZ